MVLQKFRVPVFLGLLIGLASCSNSSVQNYAPPGPPVPVTETASIVDDEDRVAEGGPGARLGDADDPAIYVHPTDPSQSFFIGTFKEGGLGVFDLNGAELQFISPDYGAPEGARFNNVDLRYGFSLGGQLVDIAVVSDRNNNTIRIFTIDPSSRQLTDVTSTAVGPDFFPELVLNEETDGAYGLSLYKSRVSGKFYVFVNADDVGAVVQAELIDNGDGTISAVKTGRVITAPLSSQCEGMVADDATGILFVGEEEVGVWKFSAEPDGGSVAEQIAAVDDDRLFADVEGLTIYYQSNGQGYLLVSSQGNNTYAVYSRDGSQYIGTFSIPSTDSVDGVEESDGSDVINVPLGPQFPQGLFVAQDGNNKPEILVEDDGELENVNTSFKLMRWEDIALQFSPPLAIDTTYNPRAK